MAYNLDMSESIPDFSLKVPRFRRSWKLHNLFNQSLLYALLSVLAVGAYLLLLAGASLITGAVVPTSHPIVIGLLVFILAVFLNPVRGRLQLLIDGLFFRGQAVFQARLDSFSQGLSHSLDLRQITDLLRAYASQDQRPSQIHIFIQDPLTGQYQATNDEEQHPTTDLRFPPASALVQRLAKESHTLVVENLGKLPDTLVADQSRLALLGAHWFVPLKGQNKLTGWMALGPRHSAEPYFRRAQNYLEALAEIAALGIERAQVVADLERRVREMNVLTRVAQGTNFTVAFDDILELIYAQTNQVIPTRDFRIVLLDEPRQANMYAFYLEDDERLAERENRPLIPGRGLEAEVITSQRPLIVDDYEQECRSRGILPEGQGLYAWMGVPLNAGADTFGVASIGSRDPTAVYTDEQRNLFQALADQAAGAIVKARLLQETERRARQLATLNEIGRSLTSTLDVKLLLNQILNSATEILNCQAGSLFLVDEQTGELVFEVVIGPVANDLLGKRLPPGTGVVGEAVSSSKPVIANDAKRRKDWFNRPDEETGFSTQDLLVVPMIIKDRTIGVIEVINKADGSPFTLPDQELLATFTSQAAVAIENARLYTLTDQALADRVEELSVMQRIDRELNASLEIDRALRITLNWAMRQSDADAGLIGIVEAEGVRLMTSQGYNDELTPYRDQKKGHNGSYLPLELPALQAAIESGEPYCVQAGSAAPDLDGDSARPELTGLLAGCQTQIAIPIQREQEVIGLLLLESTRQDSCSEDRLAFLSRLSDHAAIAIANARLYSEVQAANLAKSKFVSFVAHELKNPMSSIKGYTELIAGGMAGQVNEMQATFLNTIRGNVDRMNTIVSDLNDLTKIQVGNMRLEFKAVTVQEVLDEAIRSLRRQIDEKEQNLELVIPPDLPRLWADQARMVQIVINLVSNANKYTRQGGKIQIGAGLWASDPELPTVLEVVHIWVGDNGIGISVDDQGKIFQQYFRTEQSKETANGTGLGLSISKSLIEMQGGHIWFESVLDQGTTFHFTVPVVERD
jgi:signal transduction histidine kinase